jgi:hypothetical protein
VFGGNSMLYVYTNLSVISNKFAAVIGLPSFFYFSYYSQGTNVKTWLTNLQVDSYIRIFQEDDSSKFFVGKIIYVTDSVPNSYVIVNANIIVNNISSFSNGRNYVVSYSETGGGGDSFWEEDGNNNIYNTNIGRVYIPSGSTNGRLFVGKTPSDEQINPYTNILQAPAPHVHPTLNISGYTISDHFISRFPNSNLTAIQGGYGAYSGTTLKYGITGSVTVSSGHGGYIVDIVNGIIVGVTYTGTP